MATLRKRRGKWQVQIRRSGFPPFSRTFLSRADATLWARQTEAQLDRHDLPPDRKALNATTLKDAIQKYLREVTPKKRGADVEKVRLTCLMAYSLARKPLGQLMPEDFAKFRDQRSRLVGSETVRRELGLYRHVIEIARREWGIPLVRNPVAEVRKPPPSPARTRRLGEGEWEKLQAALAKTRNKVLGPLISCAVETGMRRGEMLAARWDHLDQKRRFLLLPTTKNGHPRYVPLSDAALSAIKAMRGLDPVRIFPMTPNGVRLAWTRLTRRAGIQGLNFHDLRHEAVSRFFEIGLTIPEVASISGHRDLRMLARYAHPGLDSVHKKLVR